MNPLRGALVGALLVLLGACGARGPAVAASAPVTDPALAVTRGEVERTVFDGSLNVVLPVMTRLTQGIYYRDVEAGTGAAASPGREVSVTYIAYLANGTEIDRSEPSERPLQFRVGDGVVIRGWDVGVRGMRSGGTRQLVVPSRHAYGARQVGKVPANSVMVFVVRLESVR